MKQYSIKDLERLTGVKAHTIRIWEQRYNIVTPHRTDTNIRIYFDNELKKLLNVSLLVQHGHKISKVAQYDEQAIKSNIYEIEKTSLDVNIELLVDGLIRCCIDFDEDAFEKTFAHCVLKMGFEDTLMKVIYPTMVRIGVMWGVDEFSPAQEHFFSHLIRKKMYVSIDGMTAVEREPSSTYILYLPYWEEHDLGLLMAYYLLRKHKKSVIYLGPNVPIGSLEDVPQERFSNIFTFLTAKRDPKEISKHLLEMTKKYQDKKLYFSASQAVLDEGVEVPKEFERLYHPSDLVKSFI